MSHPVSQGIDVPQSGHAKYSASSHATLPESLTRGRLEATSDETSGGGEGGEGGGGEGGIEGGGEPASTLPRFARFSGDDGGGAVDLCGARRFPAPDRSPSCSPDPSQK